jgi:hypothetical protein
MARLLGKREGNQSRHKEENVREGRRSSEQVGLHVTLYGYTRVLEGSNFGRDTSYPGCGISWEAPPPEKVRQSGRDGFLPNPFQCRRYVCSTLKYPLNNGQRHSERRRHKENTKTG